MKIEKHDLENAALNIISAAYDSTKTKTADGQARAWREAVSQIDGIIVLCETVGIERFSPIYNA